MLQRIRQMQELGVMGMNRRNVHYISTYNPRRLYPLVDDKLKTKKLAQDAGVNVPELIGVVSYQHDARNIEDLIGSLDQFVIKPTKGSGGKGILVVAGRDGKYFLKTNGDLITISEIRGHVSNILGGLFSLGGRTDAAMIEGLIQFDPVLSRFSCEGVPDIRFIVFQGFPVMTMIRLATHDSKGKANLHQGAVGVGLELATGKGIGGVQHNHPVTRHPDTEANLGDLIVPNWEEMMLLASRCYEMTGLGYLGADIVLDKDRGPLLLELNARPGLAIQIANKAGLLKRLRHVESNQALRDLPAEKRVEYARDVLSKI